MKHEIAGAGGFFLRGALLSRPMEKFRTVAREIK